MLEYVNAIQERSYQKIIRKEKINAFNNIVKANFLFGTYKSHNLWVYSIFWILNDLSNTKKVSRYFKIKKNMISSSNEN